ncbi:MAG: hypothetical protein RI933_289 [Actinomycetota bacterium]|jgi:hypothetical protein
MRLGKTFAAWPATIVSIALFTGCASAPVGEPSPSASPSESPTPTYVTAPLTGRQYDSTTREALVLSRPSVACKIDNGSDAARPQLGLNSTDIVFDEMVEGGLTRLVAVWHSNRPNAVGPVRSIRPMDPDILTPFGGIVCYSGGQYVFVKMMEKTPLYNASETSQQGLGTFSRSKDRVAPHNVIANAQLLSAQHAKLGPPPAQFGYSADSATSSAAISGVAVTGFDVKFPQAIAGWTADSTGVWLRMQDGKKHTDAADKSQLKATNVVVMQVKIDRSYLDRRYGNIPKTVMVDSGSAWVFSAGKVIEGTWTKSAANAPIALADKAGAPILLAPGNTWVELMPKAPEGSLTINE